jgi:hypothetical protein
MAIFRQPLRRLAVPLRVGNLDLGGLSAIPGPRACARPPVRIHVHDAIFGSSRHHPSRSNFVARWPKQADNIALTDPVEETMLAKTAKHWLGVVTILALGFGATAPAQAAPPTPITACPYTITAPGAYILTKNLTAVGVSCITIAAPGIDYVAIDLEGHSITGDGTVGVGIGGFGNHAVITNGTVQQFNTSIAIAGNFNTATQIISRQNTGTGRSDFPINNDGLVLFGQYNTVTNSTATQNARGGIYVGDYSLVSGSSANNNGPNPAPTNGQEPGIQAGLDSTVTESEAENNGWIGISSGGFVMGSTAQGNGGTGIDSPSVTDSTASGNAEDGIELFSFISSGARIGQGNVTGSVTKNNGGAGMLLQCTAVAVGNTATKNAGGNLVTSDNTCVLLDNNAP